MRIFILALTLLFAVPVQAQVSFSPLVGYDLKAKGPMVGLAFEFATPLEGIPLQPSVRPLVEYVFVDAPDGIDISLIRAQADLLARFETSPGASFLPYAKAGIGIEYVSSSFEDLGTIGDGGFKAAETASSTELAINIGGGVEVSRIFVEGGFGVVGQDTSNGLRVRVGYRF